MNLAKLTKTERHAMGLKNIKETARAIGVTYQKLMWSVLRRTIVLPTVQLGENPRLYYTVSEVEALRMHFQEKMKDK